MREHTQVFPYTYKDFLAHTWSVACPTIINLSFGWVGIIILTPPAPSLHCVQEGEQNNTDSFLKSLFLRNKVRTRNRRELSKTQVIDEILMQIASDRNSQAGVCQNYVKIEQANMVKVLKPIRFCVRSWTLPSDYSL